MRSPEIAALAKSGPSEDLLLRADIQAHLDQAIGELLVANLARVFGMRQ